MNSRLVTLVGLFILDCAPAPRKGMSAGDEDHALPGEEFFEEHTPKPCTLDPENLDRPPIVLNLSYP